MTKLVPINRIGKFFGPEDFNLDIRMGEEWVYEDMSFTCILYKVDRIKTKNSDVYGEVGKDEIIYKPPVEFKGIVEVLEPDSKYYEGTKIQQMEPGNIVIHVFIKTLESLNIDIDFGDYIGFYEDINRVRYYSVINDGRVVSDNKHSYGGYKPYYRTIIATPVSENEFRGK